MSFEAGDNALAAALHDGRFGLVVECETPGREQPFEPALVQARALAALAGKHELVTALAVTDRQRREDCHDPAAVAAALAEASGKAVVLHLSGKGSSKERIRDLIAQAVSSGISSVLAVTGDRSEHHPARRRLGGFPPYEHGYLDSVSMLAQVRATKHKLLAGAVVNPFKYTAADQYLQYYKMVRKLASGADFLVAQAGWDMKKLQELQWYLQMREIGNPVLARILLMSPEAIRHVHEGIQPGVHVSRRFGALLQRESSMNDTQSLAAQLRRVGLQVAGCRLLGYSGVQLAGIAEAATLKMVLASIEKALECYTTYADWLSAWQEYNGGIEFAPVVEPYYIFRSLLSPDQLMFDSSACHLTATTLPAPRWPDRLRTRAAAGVQAPGMPRRLAAAGKWALKTFWAMDLDTAANPAYFCAGACPKRLAYGACGGSYPDGTCEFGHAPCFFHRILAMAAYRRELDALEEKVDRV